MYIERVQRPGINPRVAMVRLRRSINQACGLDELFPLLDQLSRKTEAMMNNRKLSESDIQQIEVPLTEIRLLLTAIAPTGCGSNVFFGEDTRIKDIVDRYRDAEGRIKEMRNDLARAKKPRVP